MSDEIKVSIHGTAIYKAVRNYLNNSKELTAAIDTEMTNLINANFLHNTAKRKIDEFVGNRYVSDELRKVVREAVQDFVSKEIRTHIDKLVADSVRKALADCVLVVPKI